MKAENQNNFKEYSLNPCLVEERNDLMEKLPAVVFMQLKI